MYTREHLPELLEKAHYKNIDLKNKKVILRTCLNVSINEKGEITDDTRLKEALPVIRDIAQKARKLVIIGHMGRPQPKRLNHYHKFELDTEDKKYSFDRVAVYLENALKDVQIQNIPFKVTLISDTESALENVRNSFASEIVLLENIRFNIGEESKVEVERKMFADQLMALGDIYINDSFPDYRESTSTYDVPKVLPAYLGTSFYNEVKSLSQFDNPARPFVAVIGGAKLSEKLDALQALLEIADKVIVGGAMAYTLLKAQGKEIGKSMYEEDKLQAALEMVTNFSDKLILPVDHVVAPEFKADSAFETTDNEEIPQEKIAVDIGPKTITLYKTVLTEAGSILLNGPVGVFEWEDSASGTREVVQAIVANTKAYKLAGGGDSISAINKFGITGFDHISTGGGAMLAFLAYYRFPTLDVVLDKAVS